MGLSNFQITLKGMQSSPRIYSEDITEKQESSVFCFRSWGMLIPQTNIMMWYKYLFAQLRCPFCQPNEIWCLVATIKLETAFLFGIYKRVVTGDSEAYSDLCYGSLQVALNKIFLTKICCFWAMVTCDYFWGSAQRARVSSAAGGCYSLQKQVDEVHGWWWHTMWGVGLSHLVVGSCLLLWSVGFVAWARFSQEEFISQVLPGHQTHAKEEQGPIPGLSQIHGIIEWLELERV